MWAVVAEKVENNSAVLTTAAVCSRAIAILLDLSLLAFFLLQSLDIECCCCCCFLSSAGGWQRQLAEVVWIFT